MRSTAHAPASRGRARLLKQEGIIATEGVGFRLLDREGLRRLCEHAPQLVTPVEPQKKST